MSLGKSQQSRNLPKLHIIHQAADRPSLLQPIALPQLAWSNALIGSSLIVQSSSHGTSVNGIDDSVLGEEPHFIPPFLGVALSILGVVVVDQMEIFKVFVEGIGGRHDE